MIPTYRNKDLNIKIINNSEKNKKLKPGKSIQYLNIWVELKMIFNSISFMSNFTNQKVITLFPIVQEIEL